MSEHDLFRSLAGHWTGINRLWLPPAEQPYESHSTASIAPVVAGKFVQLDYTWSFDGTDQVGMLLIGHEPSSQVVTAAWLDSWHMGDAMMLCRGEVEANGALVVRGSYAVEGSPDWGWRTVIEPDAAALRLVMYNVSPDGEEMLAVEATYTRQDAPTQQ